jgi:hypothetical protein
LSPVTSVSHWAYTLDVEGGAIRPGKGEIQVMAQLLLALLTDLVFESAASAQRSFRGEMDRYLEDRGLLRDPARQPVPAR